MNATATPRHTIGATLLAEVLRVVREHADRDLKESIDNHVLDAPFRALFLRGDLAGHDADAGCAKLLPQIAKLASVAADMSCHAVTSHRLHVLDATQADVIRLAYVERMVHELGAVLAMAEGGGECSAACPPAALRTDGSRCEVAHSCSLSYPHDGDHDWPCGAHSHWRSGSSAAPRV